MKYVIGTFAISAAIALICYSATELFLTAFSTGQEPWQQYLKGVGVVTIVIWEAIAVLLISYCLRSWRLVTAAAATLCLIFAMAITFKQGLRLHVGTQADMVTSRTVKAQDRSQLSADLTEAKQRRTALYAESSRLANLAAQEAKQGGCGAKCMALNDQSSAVFAQIPVVNQEITDLQKRWDTRLENVHASGLPEAALAMRVAGQSEQFWTDTLSLLDPVFWTLARVFALPLAIFGVAAFFREQGAVKPPHKPQEAPKAAPVSADASRCAPTPPDASRRLPTPPETPRRALGLHSRLTPEQLKALAEWEHKEPVGPLLGKPEDPAPETPPDGDGTPAETTPDVSVPEPTTVVNFPTPPKPLSKREQAKQKKERVKQENRELVEAYVVDCLDTEHPRAEIELTPKGGHKSGGTAGDQVYQDFRLYCKRRGIKKQIGRNWFGEFVGEFIDRAKGSKGVVYGAVIRTEAKRKVA